MTASTVIRNKVCFVKPCELIRWAKDSIFEHIKLHYAQWSQIEGINGGMQGQ